MKTVGSATLTNRIWLAISWLLPAVLIKIFILPDFGTLHYFLVPDDLYCMYWNAVHAKTAIAGQTELFFSHNILAPQGVSLFGHTYTPIFGMVNWVLNDAVYSINLSVFLHLVLFSAGLYALTALWLKSRLSRLTLALLCVFNGYLLAKSGIHLNLLLIGLVPWNILLFLKAFDEEARLIKPLLLLPAFAMLLFNLVFDYYAILYTLVFVALWVLFVRFVKNYLGLMTPKKWISLFALIPLLHVVSRLLNLKGLDTKGGIWEAPDFRAFFVPGRLGNWFDSPLNYPNSPETENFVFAGISMLLLLLASLFLYVRGKNKTDEAGLWLFLTVCFFAFTFPVVKMDGRNLWYWPNSLLHYIPGLQHFRSTGRMFELFIMASLVFCFMVLEKQSWLNHVFKVAFTVLFAVIFVFEHFTIPKRKLTASTLMPLKQDELLLKNRTVLTLPWGIRDGFEMLGSYQVRDMKLIAVPGCKVCSGYISRIPKQNRAYYEQALWTQLTLKLQQDSILTDADAMKWAKVVNQSEINAIRAELGDAGMRKCFEAAFRILVSKYGWSINQAHEVIYIIKR